MRMRVSESEWKVLSRRQDIKVKENFSITRDAQWLLVLIMHFVDTASFLTTARTSLRIWSSGCSKSPVVYSKSSDSFVGRSLDIRLNVLYRFRFSRLYSVANFTASFVENHCSGF